MTAFRIRTIRLVNFPNFVDVGFTANREDELDEVASGDREWQPVVREMYEPLEAALTIAAEAPKQVEETSELCPECTAPMVIRWGRRGKFLACTAYPNCKNIIGLDREGNKVIRPDPVMTDKKCHKCGSAMLLRVGKRGPFLACSGFPKCRNIQKPDAETKAKAA